MVSQLGQQVKSIGLLACNLRNRLADHPSFDPLGSANAAGSKSRYSFA
jgi:hypothetical protein